MRTLCGIIGLDLCLWLSAADSTAQENTKGIWPKLQVGKAGEFKDENTKKYLQVRVVELVSVNMLLASTGADEPAFLVKGLPVKEYADDAVIEPRGRWEVTGTGPYGTPRKTYFIVEPAKGAKDQASLALAGEENATGIWPAMKVGRVGALEDTKAKKPLPVRVVALVSANMMLVEIDKDKPKFLVRGLPTKGLADDSVIELKGEWKVTGTGPYAYGKQPATRKNYYIVEPVKKD